MGPLSRRSLLAAALPLRARAAAQDPPWKIVYFHDEDKSSLTILDLAFSTRRSGMATGILRGRGGDANFAAVRTEDGGETWKTEKLKPQARSVFFLDEVGWIAAADGLWKSSDTGRNWQRVLKNDKLLRVRFASPDTGYAVGVEKTALQTRDGGKTWAPVAAVAEHKTESERSIYTWIECPAPNVCFIAGAHVPRRRRGAFEMPDWMNPAEASTRRQLPSLTLLLQTSDAGANWRASTASLFGRVTRFRLNREGTGLNLVEFEDLFDYPSEVYRVDLRSSESPRIYREAERAISDVWLLPDGRFLLAGAAAPGRLRRTPIPSAVKMIVGTGPGAWTELKVDYKAEARRVGLAQQPSGALFAFTDTGQILRWG
jgi:hypothetical protein